MIEPNIGDGQSPSDSHDSPAVVGGVPAVRHASPTSDLPAAEIPQRLVALQRQRVFCIKSQSRCDRSIEAFIASLAGYHAGLAETERKQYFKLAQRIRKTIEKAGPDWRGDQFGTQFVEVALLVLQSRDARIGWDVYRDRLEAEMKTLARELPVWPWVQQVKGFAELGLAVVVGEAGDLGGYTNPAKVWKRLGLAVFEGRRQGNPGEGATADDWIRHGYNRRRRAEIWAFCSDTMFRHQWRGERTDEAGNVIEPAHPIGAYGVVYARRKDWNLARDWTPGHAENDARRIMTKELIKDLWRAWREAITGVPPNYAMPPAGLPEAAE
jgi:hypothetical protein